MEDSLLWFLEYRLQPLALIVFLVLYAIKLGTLLGYRATVEFSAPRVNPGRGVWPAFSLMFRPWAIESTRRHWLRWLEFGFLHVAIGLAIIYHFVIPAIPGLLSWPLTRWVILAIVAGLVAGISRLIRRIVRPEMRVISTRDDFFCLIMVDVFLALAAWGLMGSYPGLVAYFLVTAFLLIYVPTSKISHYLYWPFARYYYGRTFARRGVFQ